MSLNDLLLITIHIWIELKVFIPRQVTPVMASGSLLLSDFLTLGFDYLDINDIMALASTSKYLRSACVTNQYKRPIILPKLKVPEILLEIATIIEIGKNLEKCGTDWLLHIIPQFKKVTRINITQKKLSQTVIQSILKASEASASIKTVIVPNEEVMKWGLLSKNQIIINPRNLKNIKRDVVNILDDHTIEEKIVLQSFNKYMTNVATKYNSGKRLKDPYETLALNNIMVVEPANTFDVDLEIWTRYSIQKNTEVPLLKISESKKKIISDIINDYFISKKKLYVIEKEYQEQISEEVSLCFTLLNNIGNTGRNVNGSAAEEKEEDLFIQNFVHTMFLKPLLNSLTHHHDIEEHGNGHILHESRYRKMKQAKENGESTRGRKGRIPDRSFELSIGNDRSYSVFLCEAKVKEASKNRPDFAKLGTMLKDVLDYAIKKGVSSNYAVTGLLSEGDDCKIYSLSKPYPKLYLMTLIQSFKLPKSTSVRCSEMNDIIESIRITQAAIDASCVVLKAIIDNNVNDINLSIVPTCRSPVSYLDFYSQKL